MSPPSKHLTSRLSLVAGLVALVGACGTSPMSVDEFCDLSRAGDLATVRLFQTTPGSDEFQAQLEVVRGINDRLFANPPDEIASVARELAPLLTIVGTDNDRVTELLDEVGDYVLRNCPAP